MAIITTDSSHYAAIATALRAKNGETALYTPAQIATKLASLSMGATLNYSVLPASTCPDTAQNNTMWVKNSYNAGNISIGRVQPKDPVTGDIWIETNSNMCHIAIAPVEGEQLEIYPYRAWQYYSSKWNELTDRKSYINGAWENWLVHLYDRGNEYSGFTGGWYGYATTLNSSTYNLYPTLTREDNSIYTTANSTANAISRQSGYSLGIKNSVNLSGVNSIHVQVSSATASCTLGVRTPGSSYIDSSYRTNCYNNSSTPEEFTLDVSGLSGLYEIAIVVVTNGSTTESRPINFRLHRAWLE